MSVLSPSVSRDSTSGGSRISQRERGGRQPQKGTCLPQSEIILCRSATNLLLRFALQKKVSRIDSKHEKIERGCSSNCAGRSYVYTDTFDVHCCGEDLCNGVTSLHSTSSHVTVLVTMVINALLAVLLLTNSRS